jgi:pimeloyl-ACP methyl ester carboxylesterase
MPDRSREISLDSSNPVRNGSTPTVLLIHGAFSDASIWSGVVAELQLAGIDVTAPPNPLRGLASDALYVASAVQGIDGPVLLVGHSYGGAVITVAASASGNVLGLVYVSGFALDTGESVLDVSRRFPETLLPMALRPTVVADRSGAQVVELHIDRNAFPQVFAADLETQAALVAADMQRPILAAAFEERASAAAWRTLPSWYLLAADDRVIHPDAQRFMAQRAAAQTLEVRGSHAVAASRSVPVAAHIRSAALSTRRDRAPQPNP